MAKKTYLVLRKELAPGESFEASTAPEFASADEHMDQEEFPQMSAKNPDGPDMRERAKGPGDKPPRK